MTDQRTDDEEPGMRCLLPDDVQEAQREDLAETVFPLVTEARQLEDGYAFAFDFGPELAHALLDLVLQERACCPFLDMELRFERERGPLTLAFLGPEGTKAFVEENLEDVDTGFDLGTPQGAEANEAGEDEDAGGCGCPACG